MQKYFNQYEFLKLDIIDVKKTYDDFQFIFKILRDFISQYNNFVNQYYFLNENEFINVKNIITKFLTYESKLLKRDVEKKLIKKIDNIKFIYIYKLCEKINYIENVCNMKKKHNIKNVKKKFKSNNFDKKQKKTKKITKTTISIDAR